MVELNLRGCFIRGRTQFTRMFYQRSNSIYEDVLSVVELNLRGCFITGRTQFTRMFYQWSNSIYEDAHCARAIADRESAKILN